MIDRLRTLVTHERKEDLPQAEAIEVTVEEYRRIEATLPKEQIFRVVMCDFKDIQNQDYVVNNGNATCLGYFIEVDGVMSYAGHFYVSRLMSNDDPENPADMFSTEYFLKQIDTVKALKEQGKKLRVTLLGQNPLRKFIEPDDRLNWLFVTKLFRERGVEKDEIHDLRAKSPIEVTHAMYLKQSNRILYTNENRMAPQGKMAMVREWLRQRRLRKNNQEQTLT